MVRSIPMTEPTQARAGDTWEWKKSLSDFPADTWTLTYTLFSSSGVLTITASADSTAHLVDVAPATTAAYTAGRYDWISQVTDGTDQYQVGKGAIQVLPDLSAAATYDGRSHARKMLDAIESILEGRATNDDLDTVRSAHSGRDMTREGLIKIHQHYSASVRMESEALGLANGQKTGRFIQTRFVG